MLQIKHLDGESKHTLSLYNSMRYDRINIKKSCMFLSSKRRICSPLFRVFLSHHQQQGYKYSKCQYFFFFLSIPIIYLIWRNETYIQQLADGFYMKLYTSTKKDLFRKRTRGDGEEEEEEVLSNKWVWRKRRERLSEFFHLEEKGWHRSESEHHTEKEVRVCKVCFTCSQKPPERLCFCQNVYFRNCDSACAFVRLFNLLLLVYRNWNRSQFALVNTNNPVLYIKSVVLLLVKTHQSCKIKSPNWEYFGSDLSDNLLVVFDETGSTASSAGCSKWISVFCHSQTITTNGAVFTSNSSVSFYANTALWNSMRAL